MARLEARLRRVERALVAEGPVDDRILVIRTTRNPDGTGTWTLSLVPPDVAEAVEAEKHARGEPVAWWYRKKHGLGEFAHVGPERNGHAAGGASR